MAQALRTRPPISEDRERLLSLIKSESLLTGSEFRLASGRSSAFFFDMKKTMLHPEGAKLIADVLFDMVRREGVRFVGGLEVGSIPLVAAVVARSWADYPINGFFVRKELKGHGTNKRIDGRLEPGVRVILFDDVTTTGGSVMKAAEAVQAFGCEVGSVITVVDREEGAADISAAAGTRFESVFNRADFA
jgi:orotate phosphoribosyltransferase